MPEEDNNETQPPIEDSTPAATETQTPTNGDSSAVPTAPETPTEDEKTSTPEEPVVDEKLAEKSEPKKTTEAQKEDKPEVEKENTTPTDSEAIEQPAANTVKTTDEQAVKPKAKTAKSNSSRRGIKKEILAEFDRPEISEKVVFINRCAKVVKGGRRFSFSALVVAGDKRGMVGCGFGKANEVAEAIRKASESAKNSLEPIRLRDTTIPHLTYAEHRGGRVLMRPASPGTGVICGGGMRAVCEVAGIKDVLGKSLGSNNHANVVKATIVALRSLRSRDEIYKLRGKKVADKKAL